MKKTFILSLLLLAFGALSIGQTLSFKVDNPRVIYSYNDEYGDDCQNLEWDLYMKCNVAGTRYFAIQVNFTYNAAALTDYEYTPGDIGPSAAMLSRYTITYNTNSGNLNLFLTSNQSVNATQTNRFQEVPTDYALLGTFRCRITNPQAMANVNLIQTSMNGQEFYKVFPSGTAMYNNPNTYEGFGMTNVYLGRIYNETLGWTQHGGAVPDVPFVDWGVGESTTVWEGTAGITQANNMTATTNHLNILNGATLNIGASKWLTVTGNLTNTGTAANLTVADGGSLITNGMITGEGTLASNISNGKWHLISPPVPGLTANLFLDKYLQTYNEVSNTWSDIIEPTTPLMVGTGYAAWADPLSYTGVFNTGNVPVAATKAGLGFNSIGNPYPSGLDISGVNTWGADISPFNWVWNQTTGNYLTNLPIVPPAQGFFVQVSNPTTVTIPNAGRAHTSMSLYKNTPVNQVSLNVSGNGYMDEAFVRFDAASTSSYDFGYDAPKIDGLPEAPQMYSVVASQEFPNLTWNTLPQIAGNEIVNLNFRAGVQATYTITASDLESFVDNVTVTLIDLKNNYSQKLNDNPVYSFTAAPGDEPGRFLLVFNSATGVSDPTLAGVKIYAYDRSIMVNMPGITGDITIYDMVGKELYRTAAQSGLNTIPFNRASAWYVVRVSNANGSVSGKVFIR
jgi:hypothetical protein